MESGSAGRISDRISVYTNAAGFESIHEERRTWFADNAEGSQVMNLVKLTVLATYRLLVEGSQSSSTQVMDILKGVIEEMDQHDAWVEIETSVLWAQKPVHVT